DHTRSGSRNRSAQTLDDPLTGAAATGGLLRGAYGGPTAAYGALRGLFPAGLLERPDEGVHRLPPADRHPQPVRAQTGEGVGTAHRVPEGPQPLTDPGGVRDAQQDE